MSIEERINQVSETLKEHNVHSESIYQYDTLPVIVVEIEWGDWKHDHLFADMLVGELGGTLINDEVLEENGSDCYSSAHYYTFA